MTKAFKYLLAITFLVFILIIVNIEKMQMTFVELFNQNATFAKYNSKGNIEGKVVLYVNGSVSTIGNLANGVKEGWETSFYSNGQIKSKTFFTRGLPSEKGYLYRENGSLEFSGYYKYGGPYGGWYNYDEDGRKRKYFLYNINRDTVFSVEYKNETMNFRSMHGFVVNPSLFSINTKNKKVLVLNDHSDSKYLCNVKDLFITVADPKGGKLTVIITVNGKKYKSIRIDNNTLKVPNLFTEGRYDIFLESHLYDKDNKPINGINIKEIVVVPPST